MRIVILDNKKDEQIRDIIIFGMWELNIAGIVESFDSVELMDEQVCSYDVMFIYLDRNDRTFLDYARELSTRYPEICIVLFSDEDSYVWESFKMNAVYYVRKCFFEKEIKEILKRCYIIISRRHREFILLQSGKDKIQFNLNDIVYIEANVNNTYVVCENHITNIKMSFSDLEKLLLKRGFLKIHRSYIVNYRHIYKLSGNVLVTDIGKTLPISKYRKNEVWEEYSNLFACINID